MSAAPCGYHRELQKNKLHEFSLHPPTMCCQCGVSCLRSAPGTPLSATLSTCADPEQVISVRVQVKNQELALPTDVGVLILASPAARPPVLQPIIRHRKVFVHLLHSNRSFKSVCARLLLFCSACWTDLTPADQDAARSLLQLFYLDGWVGGDGTVTGHPLPQHTQKGVIQLGRNTRHVHQRRHLW